MKLLINNSLKAILSSDSETSMPQPGDGFPVDNICSFKLNILWPRTEEQWSISAEFRTALIRIAKEEGRRINIPRVIKDNPNGDTYISIRFFEDHPLNYTDDEFLSSIKRPGIEIIEISD